MNDEKTLDDLFESRTRTHTKALARVIKIQIGEIAEKYILQILIDSNEQSGQPFVSYNELRYRLRMKEPRFTQEDIDEGIYRLGHSGKAEYVTINPSLLTGMQLITETEIGEKEEKRN